MILAPILSILALIPCPAQAGAGIPQPLSFSTQDGLRILADLYPGPGPKPSTLLVLAPGFSQNKSTLSMTQLSRGLSSTADLLILDFRGTGGSGGRYFFGALEPLDLKAALDWARPRYARVAVMGLSLGAYIAARCAAEYPGLIDRLLLVSPPTGVEEIVWDGGFLWQPLVLLFGPGTKFELKGENDPLFRWGPVFYPKPNLLSLAPSIKVPADFLVGHRDALIFERQSLKVYNAYGGPKTWTLMPDGAHAEHMFLQHPADFLRWAAQSLSNN